MTMATTKCVKGLGIFIALTLLADYAYSTCTFTLARTHWLMSEMGTGNAKFADTYSLSEQDFPLRDKTWDVQYRFVDLRLILYASQDA